MAAPADPGDFQDAPSLTTPVAAPYKVDADLYDARFKRLFDALDKSIVGVDAFSVQDAGITPALIEAQPGWSTVALGGGATWSPSTLSYRKDSIGRVRIQSKIYTLTVANIAAPATLATLPAGVRPGVKLYFIANKPSNTQVTAHSAISIDTNGVVKLETNTLAIETGGGERVMFSHWEYRAEN